VDRFEAHFYPPERQGARTLQRNAARVCRCPIAVGREGDRRRYGRDADAASRRASMGYDQGRDRLKVRQRCDRRRWHARVDWLELPSRVSCQCPVSLKSASRCGWLLGYISCAISIGFLGEPGGTRTHDPKIKSSVTGSRSKRLRSPTTPQQATIIRVNCRWFPAPDLILLTGREGWLESL
jgi:hypothetical protein